MNKTTLLSVAAAIALPIWALTLFTGCESADSHSIDVYPAWADVSHVNQSVVLSARGWSDYSWGLSDYSIGYLTSTHGESVTYVAKTVTTTEKIQTVTVKASGIAGIASPSNTTSSASTVYTGTARIRHLNK